MTTSRVIHSLEIEQLSKALVSHGILIDKINRDLSLDQTQDQDTLLSTLIIRMKQLEIEKYPSEIDDVVTGHFEINGQPMAFSYVNYKPENHQEFTEHQINHINQHAMMLRMLSVLAGIAYMLNESNHHHSLDKNREDFTETLAMKIAKICSIKHDQALRSMRNAEQYFVADYNQKHALLFKSTPVSGEGTSVYQIDVPYGNQLNQTQRSDFIEIHSDSPPSWFLNIDSWELNWLLNRVPKNFGFR